MGCISKKTTYYLPHKNTLNYLTENFDATVFDIEEVDATVFLPAQILLLLQIIISWINTKEVTPGSFDATWSITNKARRLVNLTKYGGAHKPDVYNIRVYFLGVLELLIKIKVKTLAPNEADIFILLNMIRQSLHLTTNYKGFGSAKKLIHETIIW